MARLFDWFLRGGPLMWLLLAASIAAVATALERWLSYRVALRRPEGLPAALLRGWHSAGAAGLVTAAQPHGSAAVALARTAAEVTDVDADLAADRLSCTADAQLARLAGPLRLLEAICIGGPLFGLLGTVIGWSGVLEAAARRGSAELSAVGGDMSRALITTVFGLVVGLEAWLLGQIMQARYEQLRPPILALVPRLLTILRGQAVAPPEPPPVSEPAPPEPEPEPLPEPAEEYS